MLYLTKALTGWDLVKADQTAQLRGGKYAARIQTGYEKDGSPQYRYFKTIEEYESYLKNSGKVPGKEKGKSKDKKTPAEKAAEKREEKLQERQSSIYKKKDKQKKVKKSLPLVLTIGEGE